MRLIDADKLIEDLQSQIEFEKYPHDSIGAMVNLVTLLCIDKIKEEPTAFYIDKVVGELEFLENNTFQCAISGAYTTAIKIVKAGGKNDD